MAKKTAKKQSAKQQAINKAYAKERNRLKSFVRRAEKRGYSFPDTLIPSIPNRKTEASIRRLKKLTKDVLYSKATYGGEAQRKPVKQEKRTKKQNSVSGQALTVQKYL